jgi:hypothetical protein
MYSRKCILAVGPKDVASVEYLIETKSGFVITSMDNQDIDNKIIDIFENVDKRNSYIEQAYLTVKQNHNVEFRTKEFQQNIIKLENDK